MTTSTCIVYITAPNGRSSRGLARALVKERLAACVNLIPSVTSTYWWKGKIESGGEALLILKTRRSLLKRLFRRVRNLHPYSVPEIIAVPIIRGSKDYLNWVRHETKAP